MAVGGRGTTYCWYRLKARTSNLNPLIAAAPNKRLRDGFPSGHNSTYAKANRATGKTAASAQADPMPAPSHSRLSSVA
jgi:hypothetical protein